MINSDRVIGAVRVFLIIYAALCFAGCNRSEPPPSAGGWAVAQHAEPSEHWLSIARSAIERNKLTSLQSYCIKLDVDSGVESGPVEITAREVHSDRCGGDPNTEPRLFTLHIDRQTSAVSSDAGSEDGEFVPLQ